MIRVAWTPGVAQTHHDAEACGAAHGHHRVSEASSGSCCLGSSAGPGFGVTGDSREMWLGMSGTGTTFDSSVFRTSQAKNAMSELWKESPRLAAEAEEHQRQFE